MKIKIYTRPACPWCKKLKELLKKKRIRFEELDITEESEYRDELLEKTGQLAVPVTDIEGEIIIGFDVEKLEEAIEKAKGKK